jgi:hypothetical protein
MNEDIKKYPIFVVNLLDEIIPCDWVKSTKDYDHMRLNLHHYIKAEHYNRCPAWFKTRNIEQKLILMPKDMHDDLHSAMSDERFKKEHKQDRKELLFNKDWSEY